MFAGIEGFRSGLDAVGGFECIGHCEIDPYPNKAYTALYDTGGELYFEDARKIDPSDMPDIDLICGGFPCQSFSVAGRRAGFDDIRGTLFFEIARIAAAKKPRFLLLENVPGLLSHDSGRTFATILHTLDELGYDVAWQVLNSANCGVPQSRNRVYIVGYHREQCSGEVLAFHETNPATLAKAADGGQGNRIYLSEGVSITLTSSAGEFAGRTGMYLLPIKVRTSSGYQLASPGDSIDIGFAGQNNRRGRVGTQLSHTITTSVTQACFVDLDKEHQLTRLARCLTSRYDAGIGNHTGERSGVFVEIEEGEYAGKFALVTEENGEQHFYSVRKLTPRECWRLQGFTDEQFEKALGTGLSNARLYKMAGNAVSVPVISAIGRILKRINEKGEQCGNRPENQSSEPGT